MKHIIKLLVLLPLFTMTACDDLFEPAIENNRDLDAMYSDPDYALGVLANGYILLPYNTSPTSDVATDDAVSNDNSNTWRAMATELGLHRTTRLHNGKTVTMPFSI